MQSYPTPFQAVDASKNPYVSSIEGNSVTTSVPLLDNGGADANVTVYYGTVDAGLSSATSGEPGIHLHWVLPSHFGLIQKI